MMAIEFDVTLLLDGRRVPCDASYSLRFSGEPDQLTTVLYKDGKRVTSWWTMHLLACVEGDTYGGNANTAEDTPHDHAQAVSDPASHTDQRGEQSTPG